MRINYTSKTKNSGAKWRAVFCLPPGRSLALFTSRNELHNLVSSGLPVCADADTFSPMLYVMIYVLVADILEAFHLC